MRAQARCLPNCSRCCHQAYRLLSEMRQFLPPSAEWQKHRRCVGAVPPQRRPFGRSGPDTRGGICPAASISMRTAGQLRRGSVRASPCSF